jgi:protein-L-isoaspartate(D-aspartate) O-methyltransferase
MSHLSASHAELVEHLREEGCLADDRIRDAYLAVDRHHFVEPSTPKAFTYADMPMPIGNEQTISAPHMHAACLDLLAGQLRPGARVLDVGSGSGFLTAVMGRLVSPGGSVVGVEKWSDLAQRSRDSIKASQPQLLQGDPPAVAIKAGNALSHILVDGGVSYDAIHVGAAAATMPENLIAKLAPGGRMIIPVGAQNDLQTLQCVDKSSDGEVREVPLMAVRYVPLVNS